MILQGSMPALVTPFRDGAVDRAALDALIAWQIDAGSSALVLAGTTGEAPTLSAAEWDTVMAAGVAGAAGAVPIVAGCGTNSTAGTIDRVARAADLGADAAMVVTPYYSKPSREGLLAHFRAVADASPLPIMVYNIPGRSAADIDVETLAELAAHERIVAVKDATGDLARVARLRLLTDPGFVQLSGEDPTAVGFNAMGGQGCVSVTANVAPGLCAALQRAALAGDYDTARRLQDRLTPLHRALFLDASPGPTKYALERLGRCRAEVRLPITPAGVAARAAVDAALAALDADRIDGKRQEAGSA
ncbi:4-hydroxy-tetrahydrodipicolinate synthase [Rhodothalassium salexigens]|uniref:4-hydroxy-tetrahydrodipicolinate synthase n=1 Tax=Rhodothalassium salexigens TaxID=1086 RepID=UPI001A922FD1|nr:4-hydroxy-tetrahydrodipicolinate synthase [Rhodothalassium salexigens]MBK5911720.1 4-hydroxy-tetrahydrodipicolinate synthase [Rhodothalassium salexigens]MBK5920493.1 4-hydroxy-tetrahydrodipicolinate synthase [Rhodothalassium salexigens]